MSINRLQNLFKIPNVEGIKVTKDGRFFKTLPTVQELEVRYTKDAYPFVSIGNGKSNLCHILLAETFIAKPESDEPLEVNHINGIKTDFSLSNLEWVTRSENILHAYKTGLRPDNQVIFSQNLMTGAVEKFFSISECGRVLGLTTAALLWYFKKENRGKLFKGRYLFSFHEDSWPSYNEADIGMFPKFVKRPVSIEYPSGKIIYYEDIATAAEHIGKKKGALEKHSRLYKDKKPYYGFIVRQVQTYYEFDLIDLNLMVRNSKEKLKNRGGNRKPTPIEVKNLETNEVQRWNSSLEFSNYLKVKKNTLQKSVFLTGKYKQYEVKYLND